jgi:hypothetical protein
MPLSALRNKANLMMRHAEMTSADFIQTPEYRVS